MNKEIMGENSFSLGGVGNRLGFSKRGSIEQTMEGGWGRIAVPTEHYGKGVVNETLCLT